jgi:hypothetical protein
MSNIKKDLKQLSKEELLDILYDLYKSNKAVKDFLNYHLNNDDKKMLNNYKILICRALNPEKGHNLKLAKGKKAISDFKKLGSSPEQQAELMFYYIECGLDFSKRFGYNPDNLMNSMESVFKTALKLLQESGLIEEFRLSAEELIQKAADLYISDVFKYYLNDFLEEF